MDLATHTNLNIKIMKKKKKLMGVPHHHAPTLHFFGECFFGEYSHDIIICKLKKSSKFVFRPYKMLHYIIM
jgi:hypothetical protein